MSPPGPSTCTAAGVDARVSEEIADTSPLGPDHTWLAAPSSYRITESRGLDPLLGLDHVTARQLVVLRPLLVSSIAGGLLAARVGEKA